ncbi:MAG: YkgJ family cysteine cluster protein [Acidobacteria bacterium]|nr:YkgJ family cysteine cluster protein [Acidobacteriota bacterium]
MNAYKHLRDQVDQLTAKLSARYSQHLVCRAGCSSCCHHHLSVFVVEAAAVRGAIERLPDEIHAQVRQQALEVSEREASGEAVACPLLIDHRCSIYESRPLICRTQGLPLLIEADDGIPEVDFCSLNFTATGAVDDLDDDHLMPLDAHNLKLALVNLHYCRENGIDEAASGRRKKMSDVILESQIS